VLWACHPVQPISDYAMLAPAQQRKAIGLDKLPLGPPSRGWITGPDMYRAISDGKPYRVRGLVNFGCNYLVAQPDPARGRKALEQLEFYVHCDLLPNPTSHYADILLPVNTAWEREALRVGFEIGLEAQERVQLRAAMVEPIGEGRPDRWIAAELAKRLGFGALFYDGDLDAAWNEQLQPIGITTRDLRAKPEGVRLPLKHRFRKYAEEKDGVVAGFNTPTRRVEIYSEQLLRHGYPALPRPRSPARLTNRFPVLLTTAKNGYFCHSQHRGVAALRRRSPMPRVDLAPAFAAGRNIEEGDAVEIRTASGRVVMRARIDADLADDVAVAEYGWWQSCPDLGLPGFRLLEESDANFNSLTTDADRDPLSGAPAYRTTVCNIVRANQGERRWKGFRPLVICGLRHETPDVVSIELAAEGGGLLPTFDPGQFLTVGLDAQACAAGRVRSYSLSNAAAQPQERYCVSVKKLPGGLVSPSLAQLSMGQTVLAQPPAGRFLLPRENEFPVVLIAGGIGITPFMSYLETLAQQTKRPEVHLFYVSQCGQHHAFAQRIRELAGAMPQLRVLACFSRPAAQDRLGRDFDRAGRLAPAMIDPGLLARRARFYLCGPDGMMASMSAALNAAGVPRFEIFQEHFASPRPPAPPKGATSHTIALRQSGISLTWTPESGSILELAERHGVRIPTGCRVGQCESCAVTLLEGQVAHGVSNENIDEDACLTCQAVPLSDIAIDA
jgi:ferredoxin-NADP reductase